MRDNKFIKQKTAKTHGRRLKNYQTPALKRFVTSVLDRLGGELEFVVHMKREYGVRLGRNAVEMWKKRGIPEVHWGAVVKKLQEKEDRWGPEEKDKLYDEMWAGHGG